MKFEKSKEKAFVLRALHLAPKVTVKLDNGLSVHVVKQNTLPLVSVRLVSRSGSVHDPESLHGLADMTATLLRRGAAGRTANEISEAVDFLAASISGFASEDVWGVAFNTQPKHLVRMFELLRDLILAPDFLESEIELLKRRTLAHLQNDFDDPGALANLALNRVLWGDHPYGHSPEGTRHSLPGIQRSHIIDYLKNHVGPQISHVLIVGDIDVDESVALVQQMLGQWRAPIETAPRPTVWQGPARQGEVIIVDKPEQTQVQVRIGGRGIPKGHEDTFALALSNTVLGGGFTSRLVRELRVKRGLTYGAGTTIDVLEHAGAYIFSSFTKIESFTELVEVALQEVAKMKAKGPSQQELSHAQRYVCGLYPARLESNDAIAGIYADIEFFNLPKDWALRYRERLMAVTVATAKAAAQKHLFDDSRVIALVGPADKMMKRAEKFGPVQVVKPEAL